MPADTLDRTTAPEPPVVGGPDSVSIIIPTRNRAEQLTRTLGDLALVHPPDDCAVDVMVVANDCSDDTADRVRSLAGSYPFPLRCCVEPRPGLNRGRNAGVRQTGGQVIAFLDDDVRPARQWLVALIQTYRNFPAHLVGGRVDLWWEVVPKPAWLDPRVASLLSSLDRGNQVVESNDVDCFAIGANFSIRRTVFEKVGEFHPALDRAGSSLLGGGETEFIRRARNAGFRLFYAPDAAVEHWVAPHRVELKYLRGVARGNAEGWWYQPMPLNAPTVLRRLVGAAVRIPFDGVAGWICAVCGERSRAIRHQIRVATAVGNVVGITSRLSGRAPTTARGRGRAEWAVAQ